MQVSTGLTTDEKGKSNFSENGTTTVNLSHSGHNREGETQATLGLGNVTVGGKKVDETYPELNRDVSQAQITTVDQQTGALNASVTVDNKVIIDAAKATVQGATFLIREIRAMGDDLSPELRSRLGAIGELVVDTLIRAGFSDEEIAALMQKKGLIRSLEGIEQANNKLTEIPFQINATPDQGQDVSASAPPPDDQADATLPPVDVKPKDPNPLAVGLAAAGQLGEIIKELEEENPKKAAALETVMLVAGGPIRAGFKIVSEKVNEKINEETGLSEKVGELKDKAIDFAGGIVKEDVPENFRSERDYEATAKDLPEPELGISAKEIASGFEFIGTLFGIGLGKKADAGSGRSSSGTRTKSSTGGAQVNSGTSGESDGLIYRSASGTPDSMTPREKDANGLSAANSLENALTGKNQVIDTSKFKDLCATCDNPKTGHVSITPKDMSQMQDWIDSRGGTEVHPLTRELMDSVVDTVKK
ncbi:hypothetical protein P3G55_22755 [Leptospira sp. 96542]|nr:hypothetical protein [Leptospira sp. 96542]